jgi:hypothetical protein
MDEQFDKLPIEEAEKIVAQVFSEESSMSSGKLFSSQKFYIRLRDNSHKEVSIEEFQMKFNSDMKIVRSTKVRFAEVSTVFLGFDLCPYQEGGPWLYETMIFGGVHDQRQYRARTFNEAMHHHWEAVKLIESTGWIESFTKIFNEATKKAVDWINSEKPKKEKK